MTSSFADITVGNAPSVTAHPADVNATIGATVQLDVNATGTMPLTYQWQAQDANGTWSNLAGATSATLTLTNVQNENNGTYRAIASNTFGSATSNTAVLTVRLPDNLAEFNNGLIAYYPFNGNANDESGNGHHGDVNGSTLTPDRYGTANKAYSFDGTDDYIDLGNKPAFNFGTSDFTISLWFKTDGIQTDKYFLGKYDLLLHQVHM